jgi:hypothetical protein
MAIFSEINSRSNYTNYRAFVHRRGHDERLGHAGRDYCRDFKYLSHDGDIRELDNWLHNEVESGFATGGDIEVYVPGFGWCIYDD